MNRLLPILLILFGCQPKTQEATYQRPAHHTAEITQVMEAHGGFDQWQSMKSLSYELENGEKHFISLDDRRVLVQGQEKTIGFDGDNVWVTPDTVDASGARFYHNLYFYFFAMPFVLGDPGIIYEKQEPRDFQGENLDGVKVSFGVSNGDSPKDNYIIWYDPTTYQMKWLMYTSTYHSRAPTDRYNLIRYTGWEDKSGLKLPTKLQWHVYKNDSIGEVRGEALFDQISLSSEKLDNSVFMMPEHAQIAPGPEK